MQTPTQIWTSTALLGYQMTQSWIHAAAADATAAIASTGNAQVR